VRGGSRARSSGSSGSSASSGAPLAWPALRASLVTVAVLTLLALAAGGVRILPWLLDPEVPWRIVQPFARSVATIAIEAAILVGWPIGWALATFAFVERGEARVLATLGEAPARTALRLVPYAAVLGAALASVSAAGARDANEPGRVLGDLIEQGRLACASSVGPGTYSVPFAGATWLCAPGAPPRLVGHAPGAFAGGALYTAGGARVAPDLRRIELDDAWLHLGRARVQVRTLVLRGLPPFAQASALPPWLRALALSLAAAGAALVAVWVTLARLPRLSDVGGPWRLYALVVGAAGPLATLGLLRALERHDPAPPLVAYLALPLASWGATALIGALAWRLPGRRVAASK
jgi:hypothetical protein